MKFTDDDLNSIKAAMEADHEIGEMGTPEQEELDRLLRINCRALIARLEAAESVCSLIGKVDMRHAGDQSGEMSNWRDAINCAFFRWNEYRKAAGK
jgi:hypothetical protein